MMRQRITCEIYEACGLGSCFTMLILGLGGIKPIHRHEGREREIIAGGTQDFNLGVR